MNVLGIIPARGGSKGVKNKNIRFLDGKPLITYAIDTAKESKLLTDYIVATDDEAILNIAKCNKSPIYKRDLRNAEDDSPIELVIFEVLEFLKDKKYDLIILLQPTAPIRTGEDVDNVIAMFEKDRTLNNVVSVIALEDIHPARMYEVNQKLDLKPLNEDKEKEQRQKLSSVYLRNGCIYATTTKAFFEEKTLILRNKKAYVMPHSTWVNIDTERDVMLADSFN